MLSSLPYSEGSNPIFIMTPRVELVKENLVSETPLGRRFSTPRETSPGVPNLCFGTLGVLN